MLSDQSPRGFFDSRRLIVSEVVLCRQDQGSLLYASISGHLCVVGRFEVSDV
jgi:hypothetical protein